jgi:hypothetical protein
MGILHESRIEMSKAVKLGKLVRKAAHAVSEGYKDAVHAVTKKRKAKKIMARVLGNPDHDAYYAAVAADDAFQVGLEKHFGKSKAGDARYGSTAKWPPWLKKLKDKKIAADEARRRNPPRATDHTENPKGAAAARKYLAERYDEQLAKYPLTARISKKEYISANLRKATENLKKRNPQPEADALYEEFHGREPDTDLVFTEEMHVHERLAGLGDLTGLVFCTTGKRAKEVELDEADLRGLHLASSENGKQLYIMGTVDLPLEEMGYTDPEIKDRVNLGELYVVVYRTEKGFDNFETFNYEHKIGKREKWRDDPKINKHVGQRPILAYEPATGNLLVIGGQYLIKDAGIVN